LPLTGSAGSCPFQDHETPLRLLFDQNLSPRLVRALADLFPGSAHVRDVGLARAGDDEVWSHAAAHGFAIVSKDADFHQRSFVLGHPRRSSDQAGLLDIGRD
jgi:predicted nuclease of predicted toxin-antitoxin system